MICTKCAEAADSGNLQGHLDCPNRPKIVEVDLAGSDARIVKLANEITTQCTCQHRQAVETVA